MKERKAVVIGAGLGGLTAAAYLAKNGFDVNLFERHHTPGGYASSFVRGQYEFEVALHQLSGIGPEGDRGPCYRLLDRCDVASRVEFLPIHDFYVSQFPDFRVKIPNGWEAAEEAYIRQFPEEREGIKRLLSLMRDIFREMQIMARASSTAGLLKLPFKGTHLIRSTGLTVSQALDREIKNPRLKALFCNVWGFYGLPLSKLSFTLFALGNASYLEYGPYHIKGTSQALSNAFVDAIEENGGRVHLGNGITKINVSDGRVTGVVDDRGEESPADHIVSNANPIHCCLDLIGADDVPSKYIKALSEGHIGMSTFNAYLGLDCPAGELGLTDHEFFINDTYSTEEQYESMTRIEKQKYWVITTYNATDPAFSPPGTTVLVVGEAELPGRAVKPQ
ncbi:phytoene desaturase family protein, partial [Thermodesulfobacteriota bacterium]